MQKPNKFVMPQFRLVEIETTEHWSDDVQARGRVFEVYLVNMKRHVYLCEITPSLEMTYLYSTTTAKSKADRDAFQDLIDREEMACHRDAASYLHVGTKFNRVAVAHMDDSEKRELKAGEIQYDDLVEEMREYYISNHHL